MSSSGSQTIEIAEVTAARPVDEIMHARELLLEYGRFVIAQPGAGRFCFGSLEKEAERLPESYLEQGGGCIMARVEGEPVGFVAWRELPITVANDAWEVKRLWVRPAARGLGLGRTLTSAIIDRARQAGKKAVYLDTAPESMGAAYRMYLAMGFVPCERYNDNPVEGLAYLVMRL
jgi:ribosomal protein S18 acetylase RimI-like enzyme